VDILFVEHFYNVRFRCYNLASYLSIFHSSSPMRTVGYYFYSRARLRVAWLRIAASGASRIMHHSH